jgi:hypothetical protein
MVNKYECSSCGWTISVGSYHGHGSPQKWYSCLYCRECGTNYRLEQSASQYLSAFGSSGKGAPMGHHYVLSGGGKITEFTVVAKQDPPEVECICGAKGPFGSGGPITDARLWGRSYCPHCKQPDLKSAGWWIT